MIQIDQDACANEQCDATVCDDGTPKRQIGNECCTCIETACKDVGCDEALCEDGEPRRVVGDDCCSCGITSDVTDSSATLLRTTALMMLVSFVVSLLLV